MFINHSDGRSFNVKFYSNFAANSIGRPARRTTCKLATVDETKVGKDKYTDVSVGFVTRNHKDVDSRTAGRDKAFGEAIKKWDKAERVKMWRQYDPTMQLEEVKVAEVTVD